MQAAVDFAWSSDTWLMRDQLLAGSPFLSQEVLRKVADKTDVFLHAIASEIFIANPDVLQDAKFLLYLETKDDPMPAYMIDILLASSNQTTMRTQLATTYNNFKNVYSHYNALIARAKLSEPQTALQAMNMMDDFDELHMEFQIINQLLDMENIAVANSRYANLKNEVYLNHYNKLCVVSFREWMDFREAMIAQHQTWEDLTPSQWNTIEDLALNRNHWVGAAAMGLLNYFKDKNYFVPPAYHNGLQNKRLNNKLRVAQNLIQLFPNPANAELNIRMNDLVEISEAVDLKIFNANGKCMEQLRITPMNTQVSLDCKSWTSGLYHYQLFLPNGKILTGNFEVIH